MKQLLNNIDLPTINEAVNFLRAYFPDMPKRALILGTGLANSMAQAKLIKEVNYHLIPNAPISTVESHKGSLILARFEGEPFWILSGRLHTYEGYTAAESVFFIHVLYQLGVKELFITNAVGGVNPHFEEGDLVVIEDHINFFPDHPLRGKNDDKIGPRFPDMSVPYNANLIQHIKEAGKKVSVNLKKGVYFGWPGPSLETPAEYKMIHVIGGDVVGMSSIHEVVTARYYDIDVCMLSVVSNTCFPKSKIKLTTLDDIIKIMDKASSKLGILLQNTL
jgi:purine-nucleoside phosphorylase